MLIFFYSLIIPLTCFNTPSPWVGFVIEILKPGTNPIEVFLFILGRLFTILFWSGLNMMASILKDKQ